MSEHMGSRTVDVIVVPAAGPIEVRSIAGTLEAMQALVGGYVEAIHLKGQPGLVLYCNEEGWLHGLPQNHSLPTILGDAFYGRVRPGGDVQSVSLDDAMAIVSNGARPCR